ncbi:MAG TPA: hypothetical protein VGS19_22115 [Streptosporangiaceae bacterium]|nr:hypothetical protein [Streptosporangiaceae bacterium]
MAYAALITWFITLLGGLYMLTIWLIERDVGDPAAQASRLPVPVVVTHMLLALAGLAVWVGFLILHRVVLAWTAASMLGLIALLGLTMFARWIPVYREPATPDIAQGLPASHASPPESAFPVAVVIAHGLLAVSTLVLVVLTALAKSGL